MAPLDCAQCLGVQSIRGTDAHLSGSSPGAVFVKTLVLLGLLLTLTQASAYADLITPGTPAHDGTDQYSIRLPGGIVIVVPVEILGGYTQEQKAKAINDTITNYVFANY